MSDPRTVCISFVLVIAVYIIYWKGPVLRKRSPFAQQLSDARAEQDHLGRRLSRLPTGARANSFADRNKILELDKLWEVDKIAMRRRCIGKHQLQVEGIVLRLPKRMRTHQGVERIVTPVVNSEGCLDWIV
jgi:hypothetical protein